MPFHPTLGGAINAVTPTGRSAPGAELRIDGGSFDTQRVKAAYGHADARGDAWAAITNLTKERAVGDIGALVRYVPDNAATPAVNEGSAAFYTIERRAFYGGVRARF